MSDLLVYTSFDELPLDSPPPDQGDAGPQPENEADEPRSPGSEITQGDHLAANVMGDSTGGVPSASFASFTLSHSAGASPHVIVPFGRSLYRGSRGQDVIAVKRALSRAGYLKWSSHFSDEFGPLAEDALKRFQHDRKILATGKYGPPSHRALALFFDRFGFLLYTSYAPPKPDPTVAIRKALLAEMLWAYNHRADWHYRQSRPIDGLHSPFKLPIYTDCSGGCTDLLVWAHGPNPNGPNVPEGYGFTGTIAAWCRHIKLAAAQCGDMALWATPRFPAPGYEHVAMLLGEKRGGIDLCWTNGSEPGPFIGLLNYRGMPDLIVSPFGV